MPTSGAVTASVTSHLVNIAISLTDLPPRLQPCSPAAANAGREAGIPRGGGQRTTANRDVSSDG